MLNYQRVIRTHILSMSNSIEAQHRFNHGSHRFPASHSSVPGRSDFPQFMADVNHMALTTCFDHEPIMGGFYHFPTCQVRKCINVMGGITRSKVMFIHFSRKPNELPIQWMFPLVMIQSSSNPFLTDRPASRASCPTWAELGKVQSHPHMKYPRNMGPQNE